jgi:hypothetical protein
MFEEIWITDHFLSAKDYNDTWWILNLKTGVCYGEILE